MNQQQLDRIAANPGRAGVDDVGALLAEIERLRLKLESARNASLGMDFEPHESGEKCLHCGDRLQSVHAHPFCDLCLAWFDVERLNAELETLRGDDFIPHDSGERCANECGRYASRDTYPYCALCAVRLQLDYINNEMQAESQGALLQQSGEDAKVNETITIELTPEQIEQLKPLVFPRWKEYRATGAMGWIHTSRSS